MTKLNRIKLYREAQHLSQTEFATELGVSQQALSAWESGEKTPRLPMLLVLAEKIGCSIEDLVKKS